MPIPPHASINDYRRILFKRKGWIIFAMIMVTVVAGYFRQKVVPFYTATAKIAIEPPSMELEDFIGRQPFVKDDSWALGPSSFLQAQYEILRSRVVAEKAAESLGWTRDREVSINRLLRSIQIAPVQESTKARGLSSVVAINAVDRNPRIAMDMANAVSEVFVDIKRQERESIVKNVYSNLVEQVRKAREHLDESEETLEEFKRKMGIRGQGLSGDLNIETTENIQEERLRIKRDKAEKESLLTSLKEISGSDIVQALTFVSEKLGSVYTINVGLKQRLLEKENELNAISQVYKEKHPEMIRVKSELDLIRRQIEGELEAAANSLQSDIQTFANLENILDNYQKRPDLGDSQSQLIRLQKEVNLNRDIYESMLRKLKEVRLTEEVRETLNVKIIEPASLPQESTETVQFPVGGAFILGFFIGVVLALMREAMDTTVRTIEDVERYLNLSVLGAIPHARVSRRRAYPRTGLTKGKDAIRK